MIDYAELQKRCQRGATNLADANNLLADCYGALGALIAENEALRVKLEVSEDTRQVLRGSLAQAEADIDALKVDRNGKVLCDLDLFENLRDAASTEADAHRQCMATYRPLRQDHLDSVVRKCDDLLAAMGKELVQ